MAVIVGIGDGAAMALDDLVGDVEPQAHAGAVAGIAGRGGLERAEQVARDRIGDGRGHVPHGNGDTAFRHRIGADMDRMPGQAMVARIAHEVHDHLGDPVGIHAGFQQRGQLDAQFDVGVGRAGFVDEVGEQGGEVGTGDLQVQPQAALQPGHVHDLAHEALHAAAGRLDALAQPAGPPAGVAVLFQHARGHADGVQGVAQVMAEHRHELVAGPVEFGMPGMLCALQFVHHVPGDIQLHALPWLGRGADVFLPQLERAPGREPRAQRAGADFLLRPAAPVDGFDLLATQEERPSSAFAVEGQSQQAAPGRRPVGQGRHAAWQGMGVEQAVRGDVLRAGAEPFQDGLGRLFVNAAEKLQLGARGHDGRFGVKGSAELGRVAGQRGVLVVRVQDVRDEARAHGSGGLRAFRLGTQQGVLDVGRQYLRDDVAGHAHAVGHLARLHVVACQQAPELAVDDDGHAHRGGHAHVGEVFDVDRRDAAQDAGAQVERRGLPLQQRHHGRAHVGDETQGVDDIQTPGLGGDVAGRIAPPPVGVQRGNAGLCGHLAAAVGPEAVGHHAVEAGQRAQLFGGELQQVFDGAGPAQLFHGPVRLNREHGQLGAVVPARLEFGHEQLVADVQHHIELPAAHLQLRGHGHLGFAVQRQQAFAHLVGHGRAGGLRLQPFEHAPRHQRAAQEILRVGARIADDAFAVESDERAVVLDASRNVDRLAVAIVEGRCRRDRGVERDGHGQGSIKPHRAGAATGGPARREGRGAVMRVFPGDRTAVARHRRPRARRRRRPRCRPGSARCGPGGS